MGKNLTAAVERLSQAAGWRMPEPDADGIYRFLLDDGLDMDVFSPDGAWCIFPADLGAAPEAWDSAGDASLAELGWKAAAVMRSQISVLSTNGGRLELTVRVPFPQLSDDVLLETVRKFLTDQAWWRESLNPGSTGRADSPFSFGGADWFPSDFRF